MVHWVKRHVLNKWRPTDELFLGTPDASQEEWLEQCGSSAKDLVNFFTTHLQAIYAFGLSNDGTRVNYEALRNAPEFRQFHRATMALTKLNVGDLTRNERKAFFLNVYNALVIHSIVYDTDCKGPVSWYERLKFYAAKSYKIGPFVYSLNDIEHGILRANKRQPLWPWPQYRKTDPEYKYSTSERDFRIFFALNCGVMDGPKVKIFQPDTLDQQLDESTKSCLNSLNYLTVHPDSGTVQVSLVFWLHLKDFCLKSKNPVSFETVCYDTLFSYLSDTKQKQLMLMKSDTAARNSSSVEYVVSPYDWGINSK